MMIDPIIPQRKKRRWVLFIVLTLGSLALSVCTLVDARAPDDIDGNVYTQAQWLCVMFHAIFIAFHVVARTIVLVGNDPNHEGLSFLVLVIGVPLQVWCIQLLLTVLIWNGPATQLCLTSYAMLYTFVFVEVVSTRC